MTTDTTTTLSPILAAALARLVTVLRVLGIHTVATDRLAGHLAVHDPSVQALRSGAMEVANLIGCNVPNQRRDAICGHGRDDLDTLTTFGVVGEAATWLADAMDALVAAEDTTLADRFAGEALRLLAWPEAQAVLDAAAKLVESPATPSDNPTVIEVIRAMGGLDAAVRAHREAIGHPMATTVEEREQAREAMGVEADAGRFQVTKVETWTAGEWSPGGYSKWPTREWVGTNYFAASVVPCPAGFSFMVSTPWDTLSEDNIIAEGTAPTEAEARDAADKALATWCAEQAALPPTR